MKKSSHFFIMYFLFALLAGCNNNSQQVMPIHDSEFLYGDAKKIPNAEQIPNDSIIRKDWENFYKAQFGWDVDFSKVQFPPRPAGNYRILIIAKNLTLNRVFNSWTFPKWSYSGDLDKDITINSRIPKEHYAIWVQSGDESDAEFLGKSAVQADPSMKIGMTLLERMILESKFFSETGKHLDKKGVTLCSGSRHSDGYVPSVYLDTDGDVYMNWDRVDDHYANYGVRRAVF